MKNKSLGLNAILNSFQGILNIIFPFITFPYVSRVLSVSGMGKYNFSSSIISYFLLIAGLGINTFAVREGAKLRDNREEISKFASKVLTINLISTLISYILLFVLLFVVTRLHEYSIAILLFSIQIVLTTIGVDWLYVIFEEYAYITVRNIIFKLISIVLLFMLVRHSDDYVNYVIVTVIASTGSYIINFIYARRFCDLRLNFGFNYVFYIKPILIIFASTVAVQIYVNSDVTMLGFLKGNYYVGIYNVSVKVYTIIASLLASVLAVTIPRLSMLMGKNKMRQYNKLLLKLVNTLLLIIIPSIFGLIILSKDVVVILGGSKYLSSAPALSILSIAIIFKLFCSVFNNCVLIPAKRESKSLIAFVIAAVINIGLNFILIPIFAECGASFTTVLAEFFAMVINLYYGRDLILPIILNRKTLKNLTSVIIGTLVMSFLCILLGRILHVLLIRVTIQVLVSIVIYFISLVVMKNSVALDFIFELKKGF